MARPLFVTRTQQVLASAPLVFLGVFFVVPVVMTLVVFTDIAVMGETITNSFFIKIAWFSLWQAVLSVVVTLVIGLPATWALSRVSFPGSQILRGILSAPFVMPAVVVASGVLAVLPASNNTGLLPILWAHTMFNISVVLRVVGPRWELLDQRLERASAMLGAHPMGTFRYVVWPHIKNSTINAALLIFIYCFTSFGVIVIVGGFNRRTIEAEIFTQAIRLGDTSTATALAVVQIVMIAIVFTVVRIGSRREIPTSHIHRRQRLSATTHSRWIVGGAVTSAVVVVGVPMVATLWRSIYSRSTQSFTISGWESLFDTRLPTMAYSATEVLTNSAMFALLAALVCVPLSLAAVVSNNRFLFFVSSLPIVVSAATLGIGLIITFDVDPIAWRSQWWLLPVVHAAIAFPLTTRTLHPAYIAIPTSLRHSAQVLGASPLRSFVAVEIPIMKSALWRATGLSLAVSLGEFGATSFLSRSGTTTMPIAISQLMGTVGQVPQQAAFALSATFIIVTVGVMSRA
jgi:thiamine transport system permease protein